VALVNRNLHSPCVPQLDPGEVRGGLRVFRFDQDTGDAVKEAADEARKVEGAFRLTLPAASTSMLVLTPAAE
jgi:hypothetical protein